VVGGALLLLAAASFLGWEQGMEILPPENRLGRLIVGACGIILFGRGVWDLVHR
jgi:hypothetical protein